MRNSQRKRKYIIKIGLVICVIAGFVFQPNTARAFDVTRPFQNIKQVFDQRVYIRDVNETFFAKGEKTTKGQKTPLVPKASSLAFCQTRGTPQFKEITKLKNFDSRAFKEDIRALKENMENRTLVKVAKSGIKIVKKAVSAIKLAGNKMKKRQVVARIKRVFLKDKKIINLSSVQRPILPEPRTKNSLFSPYRKRMEPGPAQYPIGLKKEKRQFFF